MFNQNRVHPVQTQRERARRPLYLSVIAGLLLIIGCLYLVAFGPLGLGLLAVHGITGRMLAEGLGAFAWIVIIVSAIGIFRGWLFSRYLLICGLLALWIFTTTARPHVAVLIFNALVYVCIALPLFTRRATDFFQSSADYRAGERS